MQVDNITLAHVAELLASRCGKKPKPTQNGYQSHCPCHDDQTGSLSLSQVNGKLLVHCQAGCDQDAVWAEVTKLSPAKSSGTGKTRTDDKKIVAVYHYQDATGNAIFEKVRYHPKAFSQRRDDGNGGYIYKLDGTDTTVPYRLPAVLQAIKMGDPIYCPEGEKDCDSLARLGLTATCNAQGASQDGKKPKWTDAHTAWLKGAREIVVLPDNDAAGTAHANAIAQSLGKAGIPCRILELPSLPAKGDVSDWLENGGTRDGLTALVNATAHWTLQESDEVAEEPCNSGEGSTHSSNNSGNPWGIKAPAGFLLTADSVLYHDTSGENAKYKKVSGACWVVAETRRGTKDAWGKAIRWIDRDANTHERAIPAGRFHEQSNTLAQELAEEGLAIVPGLERRLVNYLGTFETKERRQAVEKLGWLDTTDGGLCYVMPTLVLRKTQGEEGVAKGWEDIVFQPERYSPKTTTMTAKGTLAEWKANIAKECSGQPFLIFGLCASLAGSLLKHASIDSGGFHFYGRSSHGKTTLAQVAASAWGCGADPADAPEDAFIRKWNSTANALEGLAAAHTDGVMILDELQTCAAKDFGSVIYNLFGGQGKSAMDASRNLKKQRAWRILGLSTGEISSQQKIEEAI